MGHKQFGEEKILQDGSFVQYQKIFRFSEKCYQIKEEFFCNLVQGKGFLLNSISTKSPSITLSETISVPSDLWWQKQIWFTRSGSPTSNWSTPPLAAALLDLNKGFCFKRVHLSTSFSCSWHQTTNRISVPFAFSIEAMQAWYHHPPTYLITGVQTNCKTLMELTKFHLQVILFWHQQLPCSFLWGDRGKHLYWWPARRNI